MSATLFLSPPPLSLSNNPHFLHNPIIISDSYSLNPISLVNPKPFRTSKIVNSLPFNSSTTNNNNDELENPDFSSSSEPFSRAVKMPTPPWMRVTQVTELSKPRHNNNSFNGGDGTPEPSLTEKISGGRGKKAMENIVQSIEKLQETHRSEKTNKKEDEFEFGVSLEQFLGDGDSRIGGKMPWSKDEKVVFRRTKKEKVVTAAELSLDGVLLERLRAEAGRMRKWVKVKKAGVTQSVVDQIHFIWKNNELAMLKLDMPLCRNMDRAREIVEIKTGGLVVWCRKDILVVYRGRNNQLTLKACPEVYPCSAGGQKAYSLYDRCHILEDNVASSQVKTNGNVLNEQRSRRDGHEENIPINGSLFEREADRLLDGLGPRFIDWWRPKPLPVDADLLPEVLPGFRPPFRLCSPHARSKLTDDELTYLRKLALPLPTHFVLGRNRKLQGLAAAILKLWEKCHIAKIAVKWGIPNTSNEQMAYELKCLTGGILLLRNKFFIILYRGKDFLPLTVANIVAEREMELKRCQLQEEALRLKTIETFYATDEASVNTGTAGTLSEFQDIRTECGDLKNENRESELQLEAERERLVKDLRNQERKLSILKSKIERSAKELLKLNSAWRPSEQDADHETITAEERECFRKIGLKMDSSLVLGRRGVFDGVIEGLHQHWKHRETVKVITMQRMLSQVIYTAKMLEAESGGILVSVDKMKEGHAIIIYRGKNYRRPPKSVPQNLLTKREALNRSLEMQRIGSLKFFAYQRRQAISDLKVKLEELLKISGINQRESEKFTSMS
ncbi:chloroplastic group IIA intron splicing facilitator CRS1, chloroplastic [Cornus florida]|uniref:chloroplastic group IIA intron splicing facilitator CRS1, chloroplastic n=1 Tax=Cornus florida TaxID=4283 RepID=UPI0028A22F71|nr:chloroplastic group IIA intron splicing facilitator CRS1, chloroplastic [Cornus florida]XP_059642419.1 chloroplastic group IIA intron splicing facilitator CRS1, chloroplastic [Cornus florida]